MIEKNELLSACCDDEISIAWRKVHDKFLLGAQYKWFALLCRARGIVAELGLECSPRSKAYQAINGECILKPCDEKSPVGPRMMVAPKTGYETCGTFLLFENIRMGIIDMPKERMLTVAKEKGWEDVMNLTWFCFNPINGKPCGICNPCRDAMNEGMGWRMPRASKARYYLLSPVYLVARKIKRSILH